MGKEYNIFIGGQRYSLHHNGVSFILPADTNKWFTIKVTNWDDNGYITGTYELNNLRGSILDSFNKQ